jgi:uncharacterized protein YjdB
MPNGKPAFFGIVLVAAAAVLACNEHITKTEDISSIDLAPLLDTLEIGDSVLLLAAAKSASNTPLPADIRFTSLQPTVASVDPISGKVKALTKGTATIEASVSDITKSGTIVVMSSTKVNAIAVEPLTPSVVTGATVTLTASATNATGDPLSVAFAWSSANPAIATVNSVNGVVTGVSAGTTDISAAAGGVTTSVPVTVTAPVIDAITVSSSSFAVQVGSTITLTAAATAAGQPVSTSFTWSTANAATATVNSGGVVTGVAPGTVDISASASGITASKTVTVTGTPTAGFDSVAGKADPADANLPTLLTTTVASTPSTTRVINVAATDNLQTVLDTAQYGDKIVLAAGAIFTGNFVLPAKTGGTAGEWITIQGAGPTPPEGTRVSPATAAAFPKILTNTVNPALKTALSAARWRVIGIEISATAGLARNFGLVNLGDGSDIQNAVPLIATDLIFDRVYVHGTTTVATTRCFAFNSARTALVDSYVSDCHSDFDAQAIGGWNGPGPYKIVGNYLEAAAEVIAFGGADPWISNQIPSDMEIRRNHITKQLSWKGTWLMKNLVEFKIGRRLLIDGNVLENNPVAAQDGSAFVLWSVNQNGACSWCVTEHVTIRNNIVRNSAAGFQLTDKLTENASPKMNNLTIRNNVFIGVANPAVAGNGRIWLMQRQIAFMTIENNTAFSPSASPFVWGVEGGTANMKIRNNLTGGAGAGLSTPFGNGSLGWAWAADPTTSVFLGNVVVVADLPPSPPGNFYPATLAAVGLAGGATAAFSVSATLSDLKLSPTSTFKGKGTDGKDPGADLDLIATATAGVIKP